MAMEDIKLENMDATAVNKEIFQSILREIRDEINIELKHLSDPAFMGIIRNPSTGNRPIFQFLVR